MSFLTNLYAKMMYPTPEETYDISVDESAPPDGDDNLTSNKTPPIVAVPKPRAPRKKKSP